MEAERKAIMGRHSATKIDLMFNICLPLDVLVIKVTAFRCIPGLLLESNFTIILPLSPGLIGEFFG